MVGMSLYSPRPLTRKILPQAAGRISDGIALPASLTAEAALALSACPCTAFHVLGPDPMTLRQLTGSAASPVEILEDEAFAARLQQALTPENREVLAPLVEFWNRSRQMAPRIQVDSQKTHRLLRELGFPWPKPQPARLLAAFEVTNVSHEVPL